MSTSVRFFSKVKLPCILQVNVFGTHVDNKENSARGSTPSYLDVDNIGHKGLWCGNLTYDNYDINIIRLLSLKLQ